MYIYFKGVNYFEPQEHVQKERNRVSEREREREYGKRSLLWQKWTEERCMDFWRRL